jgi:hypothetical protein
MQDFSPKFLKVNTKEFLVVIKFGHIALLLFLIRQFSLNLSPVLYPEQGNFNFVSVYIDIR